MLYDPKWETTVSPVTKPDIYALPTLIAWLEKEPPHQAYEWMNCTGGCLLDRYLSDHGVDPNKRLSGWLPYGTLTRATKWDERVACHLPHTFGAALERARKLATIAEHAGD